MKKLMVVTPYFYPYVGGMEKHIYTLVKGLKKGTDGKLWLLLQIMNQQDIRKKLLKE